MSPAYFTIIACCLASMLSSLPVFALPTRIADSASAGLSGCALMYRMTLAYACVLRIRLRFSITALIRACLAICLANVNISTYSSDAAFSIFLDSLSFKISTISSASSLSNTSPARLAASIITSLQLMCLCSLQRKHAQLLQSLRIALLWLSGYLHHANLLLPLLATTLAHLRPVKRQALSGFLLP